MKNSLRLEKFVNYLALQMDQKLLYQDDAIETSKKTLDIVRELGYILLNTGEAKELR